ncbi:hypothetical protein [Mucilaginibacter sp.]
MLRIINQQGIILELEKGQSITYDKNNPLFNDPGTFFQDISYAANASFSENNKIFFQHGQLIERDNGYYTLIGVAFFADETMLANGNIVYRIGPTAFEVNLEPNLVAINDLITNVYLTDVKTQDPDYLSANTTDKFNALMLDTCKNPDNYPYIFMPITNPNLGPGLANATYNTINYYKSDDLGGLPAGQFYSQPTGTVLWVANAPFFKLTYILKQLITYLGFTPTGTFFSDPKYKNYCIYTQFAFNGGFIYPCMRYMPYILVSDFLKFLRDRFHLSFDFSLVTGECDVETFRTIKSSLNITDLTPYALAQIEQELPDQAGYTVTLKTDQNDNAWLQTDASGNSIFPPISQLVAGDGSTAVELDIGTLRAFQTGLNVDQAMNNQAYLADASYQDAFPLNDNYDPSSGNTWPLRVFNFLTYQYYGPQAEPVPLDQDDVDWYQFVNDSKRLIIPFAMPPAVLGKMKITGKYCIQTTGNNYRYLILEKISYDAGLDQELIQGKIYARTIDFVPITNCAITPPVGYTDPELSGFGFKAYFDPLLLLINSLTLSFYQAGTNTSFGSAIIYIPTNFKGAGGMGIVFNTYTVGGVITPINVSLTYEVRITQGAPKFLEHLGVQTPFTNMGAYYKAEFMITDYDPGIFDWFWISF